MGTKTTVAVDQELRKKIKKISALLDITQSAVIARAVDNLEIKIMANAKKGLSQSTPVNKKTKGNTINVSKILKDATQKIWLLDPEREEIQKILKKGPLSIDDFLMDEWITGLE
jgi:ribosomal protein L10